MARTKWVAISSKRNGVVAWQEVMWSPGLGRYVSVPGVTRFSNGPERPEAIR